MNKPATSHLRLVMIVTLRLCGGTLLLICMMAGCSGEGTHRADLKESALADADSWVEAKPKIRSAAFNGLKNAWLITAEEGHLMITRSGGESWSRVLGDAVGGRFESIGFVDGKRGIAVNNKGEIWTTDDAGQTWAVASRLRSSRSHEWEFMSSNQIAFANDQRAWIVEVFTIWRTDDGGRNWQRVFSVLDPVTKGQPRELRFLNSKDGWLTTTSEGQLYRTTNGGDTWRPAHIAENISPTDIDFVNQNTGWVCGFAKVPPYTKLYRSDDGGNTWLPLPGLTANVLITSLSFLNPTEGWGAGRVWTGDPKSGRGIVLYSLDGAQSWQQVQLSHEEPFFSRVHFVDSQHGWLFGQNNVYKTNDSGRNWNAVLKLSASEK